MEDISDKISHHGYHRYYGNFFANVRRDPTVLEIGVLDGKSLGLWSKYFESPKLYAIDIDHKSLPTEVSFQRVDQSSKSMLDQYVADKHDLFDVIIDDGSHVPAHQILTLDCLWKGLKSGGCYVIEDVETCYWQRSSIYGYEFDARQSQYNIIKLLGVIVDSINSEFTSRDASTKIPNHVLNQIDMIMIGSNCVCIVKKDPQEWGEYYNRAYRFESSIDFNGPIAKVKRLLKRMLSR